MSDIKRLDIAKIKNIIKEMYITESSYINSFTLLLSGYITSLNIVANTFEDVAVKSLLQLGKDGRGGIIALQAILTQTQLAIVDHSAKIEHFMKGINFALDWDEKFAYHLMQQVAAVFSQEATRMRDSYIQFVTNYDKINYQNRHLLKKFGDTKLELITYWFRDFQTKLYEENTDFKQLITELAINQPQLTIHTNQLDFDSIISLPIQRILKYKLFFNDLLMVLGDKKSSQDVHIKTIRWLVLASDKIRLVGILVDRCLEKPRYKLMDFIMRRKPKHIAKNEQIFALETRIRKAEAQLCAAPYLVGQHHKRASSFDLPLTTYIEGASTAEPASLPVQFTLYKTPADGDAMFHAIFGEVNAYNMIVCKTAEDKRKEIASKIRQRSQLDHEPETQYLKLALASFIEKPSERLPLEALALIASAADITITLIVTNQGQRQKHRFNEGQQTTVSLQCTEGFYYRKLPSPAIQQSALAAPSATATRHAHPAKPLPLPPSTGKLKPKETPVQLGHGRKRSHSASPLPMRPPRPIRPLPPPPATDKLRQPESPVPTPAASSVGPTQPGTGIKSPRLLPPKSPRPAPVPTTSSSIAKLSPPVLFAAASPTTGKLVKEASSMIPSTSAAAARTPPRF